METNTLMDLANTMPVLEQYAQTVVEQYREILDEGGISTAYRHHLADSLSYEIRQGEKAVQIDLNLAAYWKYIEYGRKAGKWPPRDAILEWIKVKPVIPRPNDRGIAPTNTQLAYLIQRKIGTEGIAARPALATTLKEVNDYFFPLIGAALAKDISGYVARWFVASDGTGQGWSVE